MEGEPGTYSEQFGEEFQEHILSVMARVSGFALRYRTALDSSYFVSNLHQVVAGAVLSHSDEFKALATRVTLFELCKELTDDDVSEQIGSLLKKLFKRDISDANTVVAKAVEFGKQQAMVNAVLEAGEEIDKGNRQIMPIIHDANLVGEDILNLGTNFKDDLANRARRYITPAEGLYEASIIPTGLAHLDFSMDGGLSRGELAVVLAPPKRGKTTTLINLGFGCMSSVMGLNVVHYTCEMVDDKVSKRYDDRVAGDAVSYKKSDPEKYVGTLQRRIGRLIKGGLFVKGYPTRTATPGMIRNHLYLLVSEGFIPDLVIVDYADIMKPERRLGEMRHEQAGIYEDLRQIAGEFNVAVWTASQAPRGTLDKPVLDLGDFAEAFEKAAIVDAAIAFCQTADEKLEGKCRLALMGLRSAEDGRMVLCDINRKKCLLKTTGLIDSGHMPVLTPLDSEEDTEAILKRTVTLHKAVESFKGKKNAAKNGVSGKVSAHLAKNKGVKKKKDTPKKNFGGG